MVVIKEKQIIDKILQDGSLELLNLCDDKYFKECKDYIDFIVDYNAEYNHLPNVATMQAKFPTYVHTPVEHDNVFLADNFNRVNYQPEFIDTLTKAAELSSQDIEKAKELLINSLAQKDLSSVGKTTGYDIVTNIEDRYNKHLKMKTPEGKSTIINFGISQLDTSLAGIEEEDYVVVLARPNIGKSWLAEYFAVQAWEQGKKVLYYSGEMDVESMGYRFDTLHAHFSNTALRTGKNELGDGKRLTDYQNYVASTKKKSGFIVVTPKDFNGNRPTVSDIARCAEEHKVDLIVLDQMSLLRDQRRAFNIREQYNNISTDILTYVNTIKIPVILVAQANRGADQGTKAKDGIAPELNEIMESDKIGQDAKKVLSLSMKDDILSITVKKGRNGGKDTEVKMNWNIDLGIFKPLIDDEEANALEENYGF